MTNPVSPRMQAHIRALLDEIADEEGATILFAVESGSRAWGFHSPDSDYDVRFVYARPVDWHLSLARKRDVIERPIDGDMDLSGWELGKALRLAMGSNAVIAEWLQSPIVYAEVDGVREALTAFCAGALDRAAISWHYLALLRRQHDRARNEDGGVRLKRYFYALRPALALRWMRLADRAMPPMDMAALVAGADLSPAEAQALATLTERKKALTEAGEAGPPDPVLEALITAEVADAETYLADHRRDQPRAKLWSEADALHRRYTRLAGE